MTKILTKHFDEAKLHELETYKRLDGYKGLEKALTMAPAEIAAEVLKSNLRGLGGAGFPTGAKWGTVPPVEKVPGPALRRGQRRRVGAGLLQGPRSCSSARRTSSSRDC